MDKPFWISEESAEILSSEAIIFKITMANGNIITINMMDDLEIDYDQIEEQLQSVASIFAFYGAIYSELRMNVAVLERKIKAKRGRLYSAMLDAAKAENVKLSEKTIERLIEKDKNLIEAELNLAILNRNVGKLWYKLEALRMKCDNLRSLAGFKKQEHRNT